MFDETFTSLSSAETFFRDAIFDLGAYSGQDVTFGYALTADGAGGFGFDLAAGGAVPEASTWAMLLIGFGGLGVAGWRRGRRKNCSLWSGCLVT